MPTGAELARVQPARPQISCTTIIRLERIVPAIVGSNLDEFYMVRASP
jgi:hypothetical protein